MTTEICYEYSSGSDPHPPALLGDALTEESVKEGLGKT